MPEPTRKKKLAVLIISGIIAISVALFFYITSEKAAENTELKELVAKYNQNCPLTIQDGIRLESVSLPEEKVVQYNLTLVNVDKKTAEVETIKQNIEQSLISTAKANPGLKEFRDNHYALVYSYKDKKKAFLFDVKILPHQYK